MEEIIVFGEKQKNLSYKTRPGVYAIVFQKDCTQMLAVRSLRGDYFLPGGGMEGTESHHECLNREMLEETGYLIEIGMFIGEAKKYHLAYGTIPTLNHAFFYMATLKEKVQEPTEEDEMPEWIDVKQVKEKFFHEHQVWAVEKALGIFGCA